MKPITIILDAGHGRLTPGKKSPDKTLQEWSFVRDLSNRIKQECVQLGIKCIQSNIDDSDPSLSNRAKHINDLFSKEKKLGRSALMISLHGNAAGNGSDWCQASGWEVWTTIGTTNSDKFAKIMCEVFPSIFPDKKLRGHKEKNFTLLYKVNCPCVLTENFFYDNRNDYNLMMSEDGLQRITQLHIESIKRYIEYNI